MQKLNNSQKLLVEQNMRLVGFALKSMGIGGTYGSYPDLAGAGYLGLCLAALKWRRGGAAFSGFAYRSIKREILRELKNENKLKLPFPSDDRHQRLGDLEKSELKILFEQFLKTSELLSGLQKQIFCEFIRGSDTQITAKRLGLTASAVLKNKAIAFDKFRKFAADIKDKDS